MKKIYKFITFFALLFLIILISKNVEANSIKSINIDINVDEYGNAEVTEVWNCSTSSGTEVYHPYYNLGKSKITDLTVFDGDTQYETLPTWNTSGNLSKKANKCGIHNISNGLELCWGISKYGAHTYTVKYKITNFVLNLQDSQIIYWTLIPHDFSNEIGTAKIKIHAKELFDESVEVWGYGDYGGRCYVHDGYVEMASNGSIKKDEYMTILVKFPANYFETDNNNSKTFEYFLDMAEKDSVKYNRNKLMDIFLLIFLTIIPLFSVFLPIILALIVGRRPTENLKNKKKVNKKTYYREIPYNGDIFTAYYIAHEYKLLSKKNNLFGAIILKWIKEGTIKLEKKPRENSSKEDTILILNPPENHTFSNSSEQSLYKYIYEASKDEILEDREFEKWCKRHYTKITSWFRIIIREQRSALVADGLITVEEKYKFLSKYKIYHATDKLNEIAEQIAGLKYYLTQYSLISEREPIEVHLFEDFLIYAQMLGIADKVAKSFKDLYPDMINDTCYSSYDNINFVYHHSYNGISSAYSRERVDHYFSSSSSGGGGHSSRGGGGGSFGGGGGGGGFR
ncbi:MAG: DUF2207 domain-containing protein [Clostridia bacterium]|nr:DUF2207 domain-containing protein [Clostridia bacterium]